MSISKAEIHDHFSNFVKNSENVREWEEFIDETIASARTRQEAINCIECAIASFLGEVF